MSVRLSDYHKSVFYRKSWTNRDVFQENSDIVVQSCRDLGITMTHDLTFSEHINNILIAFSALTLLVGRQEGHPACKKLRGGVLVWLSVWSKMQTCIWPS